MKKRFLMEEFHLSILAPRGLPDNEYRKMVRTVRKDQFHTRLRKAITGALRRFTTLAKTRVLLTR